MNIQPYDRQFIGTVDVLNTSKKARLRSHPSLPLRLLSRGSMSMKMVWCLQGPWTALGNEKKKA